MFITIPYGVVLTIHVSTFIFNILLVIIADTNALRWVMGWKETLNQRFMVWLHRLLSLGLAVSILSGAYLFLSNLDYFQSVSVPAFYVKIGLVVALVINAFVISRHMHVAFDRPFASLTRAEKGPLFISGAVSAVGWVGVFVSAQFIGLS